MLQNGLFHQYQEIVKTQRLQNFTNVVENNSGSQVGRFFNDSDVYKWLEACAYFYTDDLSKELQEAISESINLICKAQEPDGYINTFFQLNHPDLKWRNLIGMHEMYCGGHLIEAGVAWKEATNDESHPLYQAGIKFARLLLVRFGPNGKPGYPGHEEIELALFKLAKSSGDSKYAELATHFIECRGNRPSPLEIETTDPEAMNLSPYFQKLFFENGVYSGEYLQDHLPIREHQQVVGHAVRAMYLYIAAADLLGAIKDDSLSNALESTWHSLTQKRMYITGGIGPSGENEGFTFDYDLPNLKAYAETCAACGLVWWGSKLAEAFQSAEYIDVVERALFNGVMSGVSLDAKAYFYDNPLESRGAESRTPWFDCACCPPNVARLIGSVGNLFASTSDKGFWLHIPCGFSTTFEASSVCVDIEVVSNYPYSGEFQIKVNPETPVEFAFHLRMPSWAHEIDTDLEDLESEAGYDNGYAVFTKTWKAGDVLNVNFNMTPCWNEADARVFDDIGRVALSNGPLIYCAEKIDLGFSPQLFQADLDSELEIVSSFADQMPAINVQGRVISQDSDGELYRESISQPLTSAVAKFIPYFSWCNRGSTDMQVWIRKL